MQAVSNNLAKSRRVCELNKYIPPIINCPAQSLFTQQSLGSLQHDPTENKCHGGEEFLTSCHQNTGFFKFYRNNIPCEHNISAFLEVL